MSYTTIQISKETRMKLHKFRFGKRETYDEILNTLMDLIPGGDDEGEYTTSFKESLVKGMLDIKHGRVYSIDQAEKKLGLA